METETENEIAASVKDESSRGWTKLFLVVVAVLAGQIAFYAWLTKTFE
jgi:hypoxanthine-guanine phosphoribosyltransferase